MPRIPFAPGLLRRLGIPYSESLLEAGALPYALAIEVPRPEATRVGLLGMALAVAAADAGAAAGVCIVEAAAVRDAFAAARELAPLGLDSLLARFVPAVILHASDATKGLDLHWCCDGAMPQGTIKGLCHASERVAGRDPILEVHGEAYLAPPARRGEGRSRAAWARAIDLDAPRRRDSGGPFWRLGQQGQWRRRVLAWHERLLLAGLLGTRIDTCAVLAPQRLLPRIGFVCEAARAHRRRFVCMTWDGVPDDVRAALETSRHRRTLDPQAPDALILEAATWEA